MKDVFVKPAPGLTVRDPGDYSALPVTGTYKPKNTYWIRRLRDGDVMETRPPARPKPAPPTGEGAKKGGRANG